MGRAKKSSKDRRTAPESDGSSNSNSCDGDSSSSESDGKEKTSLSRSNDSLQSSDHSGRSSSNSKRSNLKRGSTRAPLPEADLPDSEEYGDIMKDYCYNENNVLVPRIKLQTSATPTIECDDDDASVGSARRIRRGGRNPNNNGDEGFEDVNSPTRQRPQRRNGKFSFWDQDNDSSDEDAEILNLSASNHSKLSRKNSSSSANPPQRLSMTAAPRKSSNMSRESSSSSEYFTAEEAPPERRAPGRNDSGWYTGGSFDSDDDDDFVPTESKAALPKNNLAKLSQAAMRMGRSDNSTFSFTKTKAKMDNYASKRTPVIADPIGLDDDKDDELDNPEEDNSNHSSASKTTSSFVSAGGWSTGKDSSSSEEDDRKRTKPVAVKKSASKRDNKIKAKQEIKHGFIDDLDPFAEFDNPKTFQSSNFNISGHSTDSKFSFISGTSGHSMDSGSTFSDDTGREESSVTPRQLRMTDFKDSQESAKLPGSDEENNGSFVFDLTAMHFDFDGIFEDGDAHGSDFLPSESVKKGPKPSKKLHEEKTHKKSKKAKKEKETHKKSGDGKKEKAKSKHKSESKGETKDDKLNHNSEHVTKKEKAKSTKLKKAKDELGHTSEHVTGKEKMKHSSKPKKDKSADSIDTATSIEKAKPKKKKKSSDEKSPMNTKNEVEEEKETAKEVMPVNEKMTPAEKAFEKRRQERAARLEKAKERIRQQEADKKEEADTAKKMKSAFDRKKSAEQPESERRERAYQWYTRCGMLSKDKLKERIKTIEYCDITDEDIDLLPWMTGDRIVNVAKMTKLMIGK